jgi:hypothetical protein
MLSYIDILLKNIDNLLNDKLANDNNIKFLFDKVKQYREKSDKSQLLYFTKSLSKNIMNYKNKVNYKI